MHAKTLIVATILLISIPLLIGCGGGKTNNANPNPNPNPTKSDAINTTTLQAVNDVQDQGLVVTCGPGTFEPDATVHIIDPNGTVATGTALSNGQFNLGNWQFPQNFITAIGTTITITQVAPGKTESDPLTMVVQDITQI